HEEVSRRRCRKAAAVGHCQRAAEGRVQRRRRSVVCVGVLREPGSVAETCAAGADGTRISCAQAHGAPDGAGGRAAGKERGGWYNGANAEEARQKTGGEKV